MIPRFGRGDYISKFVSFEGSRGSPGALHAIISTLHKAVKAARVGLCNYCRHGEFTQRVRSCGERRGGERGVRSKKVAGGCRGERRLEGLGFESTAGKVQEAWGAQPFYVHKWLRGCSSPEKCWSSRGQRPLGKWGASMAAGPALLI